MARRLTSKTVAEVLAVFGEPRRMMFSAVLAATLRGSQELAPQDDAEIRYGCGSFHPSYFVWVRIGVSFSPLLS